MIELSDDARGRYQQDVDAVGRLFDKTVARNRGLTRKQVFDTQAGTFWAGGASISASPTRSPRRMRRSGRCSSSFDGGPAPDLASCQHGVIP
jgi:hypothetical protein